MAPGVLLETQPIRQPNLKAKLDRLSPIKLVADHFRDAAVSLPPEPESPVSVRYARSAEPSSQIFICFALFQSGSAAPPATVRQP